MSMLKRGLYMGMGAMLMLVLVVAGFAAGRRAFAQSGDAVAPEGATLEDGEVRVWHGAPGGLPREALGLEEEGTCLAEALGIRLEELQAAYEAVREGLIDRAVEEGLIGEVLAERLREAEGRFDGRLLGQRLLAQLDVDRDALLAEALGIRVEELDAARATASDARLAELVDAGVLTQERAEMMAAQAALAGYLDQGAAAAALQALYETAIDEALADGAITQEQADLLRENMPAFDGFHFGPGGRGHEGRGHGPGGVIMPDVKGPAEDMSSGL